MIELIKDSSQTCKRCEYLRTLIAKAEVRAKAKGLPATISLDTFKGVNNCQLTGIPLIFESVNSLTKASLDRLNSNEGYTVENTVLRCIGINFAKGNMSEEEFLEFLHKVGRGEKRSLAT